MRTYVANLVLRLGTFMASSDRPLQAFVSSTFIDLKDHRAHVINSLRNAGLSVDPMENWTADSDEPKQFSQDRLNGCDLCVVLVAFRRGFVPDGETRSITQMEYDRAVKQGIDILPFVLAEDAAWPRKFDELDKDPEARIWREQLRKRHGVESFSLDPRSIDMTGALGRWLAKKRPGRPESEKPVRLDWPDGKSPYRGLEWFTPEYAPLFLGRNREVDELVGKMSESGGRVLLVIGASGSGKSSVVAAGVWKAVLKDGRLPGSSRWKWQRIQPSDGDTPWDAVARGLKGAFELVTRPKVTEAGMLRDLLSRQLSQGEELILFVDQFEELFTSGFQEADIQRFLELLIGTARDTTNRLRVVATIRSEFLGKLEVYDSTLNLLNSPYRYHLGPVSPRMLQDMIEKPAEATGYTFESGLVERILQDTGQEPGNLALVEYALKQLFERRASRTFTVEAYETIGGVVGAIATKANEVLSGLDEDVRGAFDRVFAELVHLDRERPPTRRRTVVSTFSSNPAAVQLIEALAGSECRVLVTNGTGQEGVVEVAHEKLFTSWSTLTSWIEKSGEALREIDHAEEEARRWQKDGDNSQELWLGSRARNVFTAIERFGKTPSAELERFLRPQQVLIEKLSVDGLAHVERLLIGQKLAEFGDTRPGVGVKNGMPDIVWIDIPGGPITLDDVDHVFQVQPFKIAKYPVTNAQFEAFLSAGDGYRNTKWWRNIAQCDAVDQPEWSDANAPRETVSWFEAVAFCRWLGAKMGTSVRLPTEWEWQQAATSGDPMRQYPWGGRWDDSCCNGVESRLHRTTAVGMYPLASTRQGVLDMAGNVWEWCQNGYENPEQPEALQINKKGARRVLRGGSWYIKPVNLRASNRNWNFADTRFNDIGFRLVQDLP
ncbi:MAG: SUMF1/EgtB/PvdO family nonheme iron enzyme [Nitrospira sp.]|nr:SUMF1/EgtB/PvdO family nonheme iron enzyme [Nitrospira sp.]